MGYRIVLLLLSALLFAAPVSCTASSGNSVLAAGTYLATENTDLFSSYLPNIVLNEDCSFVFNISSDTALTGKYELDQNTVSLIPDDETGRIPLTVIDKDTIQLSGNHIPEEALAAIKSDAVFRRLE